MDRETKNKLASLKGRLYELVNADRSNPSKDPYAIPRPEIRELCLKAICLVVSYGMFCAEDEQLRVIAERYEVLENFSP